MAGFLDYMLARERTPAFNSRGEIRGFRSRPGAPQADLSRNTGSGFGKLPSDLTPQSNWDALFKNRVTGETPSSLAAKRAGTGMPASNWDSVFGGQMSGAAGAGLGLTADQTQAAGADLATMAAGGMTHTQKWSQQPSRYNPNYTPTSNPLAGTGYETGNADEIAQKYSPVGVTKITPGIGWDSAFQNMDEQNG